MVYDNLCKYFVLDFRFFSIVIFKYLCWCFNWIWWRDSIPTLQAGNHLSASHYFTPPQERWIWLAESRVSHPMCLPWHSWASNVWFRHTVCQSMDHLYEQEARMLTRWSTRLTFDTRKQVESLLHHKTKWKWSWLSWPWPRTWPAPSPLQEQVATSNVSSRRELDISSYDESWHKKDVLGRVYAPS